MIGKEEEELTETEEVIRIKLEIFHFFFSKDFPTTLSQLGTWSINMCYFYFKLPRLLKHT